ncbi:uncharacterized protein [Miscanthus floridulus]|uniref:uncharacterized protein n=1 Tax=Miscanthus floridulus TaxID=154761 RepID=UPI0034575253
MPRLEEFAGPVAASVSVVAQQAGGGGAAVKEESLYVMHGVRDGVAPRFHVLRPPTDRWGGSTRVGEGWYWQSLPPPPFVSDDDDPDVVISSYTVVEGGRTICVSSYADEAGTWCFDTVRGEWWHAGDWEMPFDDRAEYLADLDLWLGLSSSVGLGSTGTSTCYVYGELCTTSSLSLSAMAMNQPPTLLRRLYTPPEKWMMATNAKQVELINLGSGRFAIAKVFNWNHDYSDFEFGLDVVVGDKYDELLVVTGVEIRPCQPRDSCYIWSCSDGLELIPHKSISYMCRTHRIHQVL